MLTGSHVIITSAKPDADRAFLRDVLGLPSVDAGDGWLIFGLPPSEVAIHPGAANGGHQFYLMVENITVFAAAMKKRRITCSDVADRGWGLLLEITLPGGGTLGVYQPRHARPKPMAVKRRPRRR